MRGAIASAVLLCGLVAVAQEPSGPTGSAYYPIKAGSKWTYVVRDQKDRFVVTMDEHKTKIGNYPTSWVLRATVGDKAAGEEFVAPTADGIVRIQFGTEAITPELPILKKEAKKDDRWTAKFRVGTSRDEVQSDCAVDEETVKVPAGEYKAIKITSTVTEKGMSLKSTVWYAKEVGMVKQEISFGDSRIELDLEKYEKK